MHVTFKKIANKGSTEEMISLKGELRISMMEFLKSLISLRGSRRGRFICLFLQTLLRTYILQVPRGSHNDFDPLDIQLRPYPSSILHEIKTGIASPNFFSSKKTKKYI